MTVSDARASLPELLDRVAAGEEITITRHGRPAAVLVGPQALRVRRAGAALAEADELRARLDAARAQPPSTTALDEAWAEELIAEIRAGRDG
jgi:prevent-host-death family protein